MAYIGAKNFSSMDKLRVLKEVIKKVGREELEINVPFCVGKIDMWLSLELFISNKQLRVLYLILIHGIEIMKCNLGIRYTGVYLLNHRAKLGLAVHNYYLMMGITHVHILEYEKNIDKEVTDEENLILQYVSLYGDEELIACSGVNRRLFKGIE